MITSITSEVTESPSEGSTSPKVHEGRTLMYTSPIPFKHLTSSQNVQGMYNPKIVSLEDLRPHWPFIWDAQSYLCLDRGMNDNEYCCLIKILAQRILND